MRKQERASSSHGREHTIIETARYAEAIERAREFGMPWTLIGNKLAKVVAGFPAERQKARRIMDRAIVVAKELELSNVDITQLEIPGMNALTHGLQSSRSPVATPLVTVPDVQVPTRVTSDKLTTQLLRPDITIQNDSKSVEPETVSAVRRDRAICNQAEKLCLIEAKMMYVDVLTDELPPFGTGSDYASILASDTSKVSIVAVMSGARMGIYACLKSSTYSNAINFDLLLERYGPRITGPRFPAMPPGRGIYDMIAWAASPAIQSVLTEIIKEELREWFESLPLSARYPSITTSVVRVP